MTDMTNHQPPESGDNRRRSRRFEVPARVAMRGADGKWHWHDLRDLSAVGVAVADRAELDVGRHVPLQIERVGAALGRVVRTVGGAPCFDLAKADTPVDLRARRVEWLASDKPDHRRNQRVRPSPPAGQAIMVPLELTDGTRTDAQLEDVSATGMRLSGVGLDGMPDLAPGTPVAAGGTDAHVVWVGRNTLAVTFADEVDVKRLKLKARAVRP